MCSENEGNRIACCNLGVLQNLLKSGIIEMHGRLQIYKGREKDYGAQGVQQGVVSVVEMLPPLGKPLENAAFEFLHSLKCRNPFGTKAGVFKCQETQPNFCVSWAQCALCGAPATQTRRFVNEDRALQNVEALCCCFIFEVDDEDLQDEPLQITVLDHDTYSANDAIGKVYIDIDPLLYSEAATVISGWFPIYDTIHGECRPGWLPISVRSQRDRTWIHDTAQQQQDATITLC